MSDGWSNRFSDFGGSKPSTSSKKFKADASQRHNNTFKFNRSKYAPLKLETTPSKKQPLAQTSTNTMGPPATTSSAEKQKPPVTAEKVNSFPDDLEDWGDDDFDIDLNNLVDNPEEEPKKEEPKITDEELQEMTMALLNDDSVFDMDDDEPPPPMDPSKARLNQTTAVFAACAEDFFDEGPKPEEIIETLRNENKKLNSELKALVPLDNQRKAENTELQKRLERESKMKKNLENDLKRERENMKKAMRDKEVELRKLRTEFELKLKKQIEQAALTQRQQQQAEELQQNNDRSNKKRKLSSAGGDASPRRRSSLDNREKHQEDDLYSLSKIGSLPDFFVEQFCSLTTSDPVCQKDILIKMRNREETREDWARMLDISADKVTKACCHWSPNLNETRLTASGLNTSNRELNRSIAEEHNETKSVKTKLDDADDRVIRSELRNILHMINFNGDNFKSQEIETILDTCTLVFRCMLSMSKFPYLEILMQLIRALWEYEPPEVSHLNQILPFFKEIFQYFQGSQSLQASPGDRTASLELFFTLANEEEILPKICTKSDSCFLQSIFLELESGCYKLKVIRDVAEAFDPSMEPEIYSSRSRDTEDCTKEDLTHNYKVIEDGVGLIARFVEDSVMTTEPAPWINAECLNCNCILLRAVVALLFSCISIYLDRISDSIKEDLDHSPSQSSIRHHIELCVETLYKMKMEVVGYKESVTQPWIKVVEKIQSGNKKRFVWSIDILKYLISDSLKPTLEKLEMERMK